MGDGPLEDLQKDYAYAPAHYPFLDQARACALGGSHGTFMVNWIAGNWKQPRKCLVNHDGSSTNRIMAYSTEELWFSEAENGHRQDAVCRAPPAINSSSDALAALLAARSGGSGGNGRRTHL